MIRFLSANSIFVMIISPEALSGSRLCRPLKGPATLLVLNLLLLTCFSGQAASPAGGEPYLDRFVWVFGWNLGRDSEADEIVRLIDSSADLGYNGALVSFGLDTLCRKFPEFFRRLDRIQAVCDQKQVELIPAIFSVGYGGGALAHDRNLAEGLPVQEASFRVSGAEAHFVPDPETKFLNGDFEVFRGDRFDAFNFHDQPGEVSFADTTIQHGGVASIRLENFTANVHGHGRVMQEVRVRPHRAYRVTLWVKTTDLGPVDAFQVSVLAGDRSLAPRRFNLKPASDWQKLTFVFNSLTFESVRVYAGVWGGKSGKFWIDDWSVEEVGPLNVLHRPGTPVVVRSEEGQITYEEGKDYASLIDHNYSPYRVDRPAAKLRLLPGSRIREGQSLLVSYYHSQVIYDSQVTVCMAEPALYEVFEHEAKLLAERVHPRRVMLNMDEVRMAGTCLACEGRNLGELLGECITKQTEILRRYLPGVEIYIWSDMLDPHHNAHDEYYLAQGDFTGSWRHVPKDLIVSVWGGSPRPESLKFFAEQGFRTLVACYYDADDLSDVRAWLDLARPMSNVRGFMYTPWQKKYALLPEFADLIGRPMTE